MQIGDLDGGGVGDIVVGADNFPETAATAHSESHCARDCRNEHVRRRGAAPSRTAQGVTSHTVSYP